jgi:hypothetical protein
MQFVFTGKVASRCNNDNVETIHPFLLAVLLLSICVSYNTVYIVVCRAVATHLAILLLMLIAVNWFPQVQKQPEVRCVGGEDFTAQLQN